MKETIMQQLTLKKQEYETGLAEFEQIQTLLTPFNGRTIKYLEKRLPEGMSIEKKDEKVGIRFVATENFHPISHNHIINVNALKELGYVHFTESQRHLADVNYLLQNPEKIEVLARIYSELQTSYATLKKASKELDLTEFQPYNNPIFHTMLAIIKVPYELINTLQQVR